MRTIRRFRQTVGLGLFAGFILYFVVQFAFSFDSAPFVALVLFVLGAVVFVGLWAARGMGKARSGALAGAIAFGIGNLFFGLVVALVLTTLVMRSPFNMEYPLFAKIAISFVVLSPFVSALLGAALGALGGLVGRRMYQAPASQSAITPPPLEPGVPLATGRPLMSTVSPRRLRSQAPIRPRHRSPCRPSRSKRSSGRRASCAVSLGLRGVHSPGALLLRRVAGGVGQPPAPGALQDGGQVAVARTPPQLRRDAR